MTRIQKNLKRWAAAINESGIGIPPDATNVFGFVDGSQRKVCVPEGPPIVAQAMWNGHKGFPSHAYLGLLSPEGLFVFFVGPFMGCNNDYEVFKMSQLYKMLDKGLFADEDGKVYRPFSDMGYHCGLNILTGFREAHGNAQRLFNTTWSQQRVFVEQGFGQITNTFRMHQFMPLQRVQVSRLSVWYLMSVVLTNCQVCLYGSKAANHFKCPPPSLEEYLKPWEKDEQFAAVFDRFRPDIYWMRLHEEPRNMYNVGTKEMGKHEDEEEEEEEE